MPYQYSELKKKTLPTIDQASDAVRLALNEDFAERDARRLMAILNRLPVANPRLEGHITTRVLGVHSFDWKITPHQESDKARAEEATARLRPVISKIIMNNLKGPLFGIAAHRIGWLRQTGEKYTVKPVYKGFIDPTDLDTNEGFIYQITDHDKLVKTIIEDTKDITYIREVFPDLGGILRGIMFHVIQYHLNLQEWANFNRKAKGVVTVKYEPGAAADEIAAAKSAGQQAGSATVLTIPKTVEMEIKEAISGLARDSFREYKEALQADIAIAILGQANTTELAKGSGSRAALQIMDLIQQDRILSDIIRIEEIINDQLLPADARFNLSETMTESPFRFAFDIQEIEDHEKNARVIDYANQAGIPLPIEQVYEKIGFRPPVDGEKVLTIGRPTI